LPKKFFGRFAQSYLVNFKELSFSHPPAQPPITSAISVPPLNLKRPPIKDAFLNLVNTFLASFWTFFQKYFLRHFLSFKELSLFGSHPPILEKGAHSVPSIFVCKLFFKNICDLFYFCFGTFIEPFYPTPF